MYINLKKIILKIFPKKILYRFEYSLRYLYYLKFIGNKYKCNICDSRLHSFVEINNERLCPRCGSLKRTRRLWEILVNEFMKINQKILDFSPSRSIYRLLKKSDNNYISSDLSGNFISDVTYNIKDIDSANENFNLIICYHILEHIDDDRKAMSELWRVLKKGGCCIIQTPFKDGEIYEDKTITTPNQREIHFGQSDHVRIYSINGLVSRLENIGFKVEIRNFIEEFDNINGFNEKETVILCYKSN